MLVDVIFQAHSDWHKAYANKSNELKIGKFNDVYHPFGLYDSKKIFIYGEGYVKPTTKSIKTIEIPDFNSVEVLKDFLETYGKYVTYRALTNRDLFSNDCSWQKHECDFNAMLNVGVDKWFDGMTMYHDLLNKLKEIYMNKWGVVMDNEYMQTIKDVILFRNDIFIPSFKHYIFYPIKTLPYLNPITDDECLVRTYVYLELKGDFDLLATDNVFPISVADRLTYLFSKDVSDLYKKLMNYFTE